MAIRRRDSARRLFTARRRTNSAVCHNLFTLMQPNRSIPVQYSIMDIDALHSALLSITLVSQKIRAGQEMIDQVETVAPGFGDLLVEAESDLRVATATLACELGFHLCPNCWPPELTTTDRKGRLTCPTCGVVPYEAAA